MSVIGSIPYSEYRAIDACNWSSLKSMIASPLQYKYDLDHPRQDSPALLMGRAVHKAVLEPDRFADSFAVFDGPVRRGKAWEQFKADNAGKDILKMDEADRARSMAMSVHGHEEAAYYLTGGKAEQSIAWEDRTTGIRCKARVDMALSDRIVELKTTRNIAERDFIRDGCRLRYFTQLIFYMDGAIESGLISAPPSNPVIIAVQSEAPHDVNLIYLDEEDWSGPQIEYTECLKRVASCREYDQWPGMCTEGASRAELPEYSYAAQEVTLDGRGL